MTAIPVLSRFSPAVHALTRSKPLLRMQLRSGGTDDTPCSRVARHTACDDLPAKLS